MFTRVPSSVRTALSSLSWTFKSLLELAAPCTLWKTSQCFLCSKPPETVHCALQCICVFCTLGWRDKTDCISTPDWLREMSLFPSFQKLWTFSESSQLCSSFFCFCRKPLASSVSGRFQFITESLMLKIIIQRLAQKNLFQEDKFRAFLIKRTVQKKGNLFSLFDFSAHLF